MFRLILLLALSVIPATAHAYEAAIVFNGCNEEQKDALRSALDRTDKSLTDLLGRFDRNELGGYVKAWFGDNDPDTVRERYAKIRAMLDRPRTVVLSCEERKCDHDLYGYSQGNSISVCPDFFASKLADGYNSMAGTLIHEFSHSYADTDDHAYGMGDVRILAHAHPEQAIENADSYQYLFEAVTGNNVPYPMAGWTRQDSCQWAYDGECDHPRIGTGSCRPNTDTTDCRGIPVPPNTGIKSSTAGRHKPDFGPRNPKDTCVSALNGICDASCTAGTDYTDCLTGTGGARRK